MTNQPIYSLNTMTSEIDNFYTLSIAFLHNTAPVNTLRITNPNKSNNHCYASQGI